MSATALTLTPAEHDQVLIALELAIATRRDLPEREILVVDVDCAVLDRLADRLVALGAAAA